MSLCRVSTMSLVASSSSSSFPSTSTLHQGNIHMDSAPRLTHTNYGQWRPRMEAYMMRSGTLHVCKNEILEWKELMMKVEEWECETSAQLIKSALAPKGTTDTSTGGASSSTDTSTGSRYDCFTHRRYCSRDPVYSCFLAHLCTNWTISIIFMHMEV